MITIPQSAPQATHSKAPASIHAIASRKTILANLEKAGVSDSLAKKAAAGYVWAQKKKDGHLNKNVMAIVDFSKASSHKRLDVVDLSNGTLIGKYYVAHGSASGGRYATHFSNIPDSHKSSVGIFAVGHTYYGVHGLSRHMIGLEPGINNNAVRRNIELHRANYLLPSYIRAHHQAGRTWGCFGINPKKADSIIKELPANTVLFAYAKQENSDRNLM